MLVRRGNPAQNPSNKLFINQEVYIMKMIMTEAEKVFVNEFLNKVESMCDSEDNTIKVVNAIKNMIDNGEYPENLWK